MLAVLDLEQEALAAEMARLAGDGAAEGAPVVEIIDRATWACVERLQAVGLLQRAEGPARVLHRAAGQAAYERAQPARHLSPPATPC